MSTQTTTELAKQRTRAAADRTLLAWINSTLLLFGFGIAADSVPGAFVENFPDSDGSMALALSHKVALVAIASGLLLLAIAIQNYITLVSSLQRADYILLSSRPVNNTATAAVLLFGMATLVMLLLGIV